MPLVRNLHSRISPIEDVSSLGEENLTFIETFGVILDVRMPVVHRESLLVGMKENIPIQQTGSSKA
jgi:hypothetical protein